MSRRLLAVLLLAALAPAQTSDADPGLRELVELYRADKGALERFYSAPTSDARAERLRSFYREWEEKLDGVPFTELGRAGQVDAILFRNLLQYERRRLNLEAVRIGDVADLVPVREDIIALFEARRRLEPVEPEQVAGRVQELAERITAAHERIEAAPADGKTKKAVAVRAARQVGELRKTAQSWFDFYNGYDPLFTWWVGAPYKELDAALEAYAALLREKLAGLQPDDEDAIVGDPIGREALLTDLAYEMVPYTPEELVEIADKEFAWCDREMLRASREMGFGDDWRAALEKVKTLHVEPGAQPSMVRDLAVEAINFIEEHNLVTVPALARETWRMEMMSPEKQKVNPFFLGGETIQVSFPTDTMPHELKLMSMRGNNVHFSRATVHHELIPGHHLQQFMTARHRPYRRAFATPFWTEGWSLWWEMLLWDEGLPKTPEDRVGFLFWRMHRCARIIFSLSFHLERMSAEEAVDFLVERVGHERANAEAEVRRSFTGDYSPLYQCAYMLGALQFRALHGELVDSERMTNREFHDAILRLGRMPIEMVRASLTGQPLTPDYQASWRFYRP